MIQILNDLKKSIIEHVRARAPDIPADNFHPDPPQGNYERPCFYLSFQTMRIFRPFAGVVMRNIAFDVGIEVIESETDIQPKSDETDSQLKSRIMESIFEEKEDIPFYHYEYDADNRVETRERREGFIKVQQFSIQEGLKDRQRNAIKARLTVVY